MKNFIIIVLDGVGIGEMPDADKYGDTGSHTLKNIAGYIGGLHLPNLQNFGLGNIDDIKGIGKVSNPLASFGKMFEVSPGKDSTTGHWELGGLKVEFDFPYYPNGFPHELIDKFILHTKTKNVLGNKPASGTAIIEELGDEHVRTGFPIVYTSADSVFQIAAHEEVIPLKRLYEICEIARNKVCIEEHSVGRIIARPFTGSSGNYTRTTNRKDFSLDPLEDTILNYCRRNNIETIAIGKINDLFNYNGISASIKTKSNAEGVEELVKSIKSNSNSLIFINLVDFDVYYGHRNDPRGFANALKEFDECLPKIVEALDSDDVLIITADHGNDPTTPGTDHSREYVPLLYYNINRNSVDLGIRKTFADVAQTAAHFFKINNTLKGKSFLNE